MIKRIIFFLSQTLSQRNYDRLGFDILKSNGFEVSVLDFTPYLYPDLYKWEIANERQVEFEEIFLIHDLETAIDKILHIPNETFIIALLPYSIKTISIYRALSETNAKFAVFVSNAFPRLSKSGNLMLYGQKLLSEFIFHQKEFWLKVENKLKNYKLKYSMSKIKSATLLLAGGSASVNYCNYPIDEHTEILWLHQLDYDLYLKEIVLPYEPADKAVFLDACLFQHSDDLALNIKQKGNQTDYYSNLNKFFDLVERDLGLKVEIAAHPRSTYNNNPFGNRPMKKFETAHAVRESKLVIADDSTSINYAVLFNKPVILTVSKEMHDSVKNSVYAFAYWLGKDVINIDNIETIDWKDELKINQERYEKYKNSYIKTAKSPILPFWQIVADRLREI